MIVNNGNALGFNKHLRYTAIALSFSGLVDIPIGLLTANLMAYIVESAVQGKTSEVINNGMCLVLLLIGYKVIQSIYGIITECAKVKAIHKCKIELYRTFLSNPLSVLCSSNNGRSKEKINDDFNAMTSKYTSLFPGLIINSITIVVYFGFIAQMDMLTAIALVGISLLQILPSVVVMNTLKKNYDDTRDIEAKLTDFTVEAHRGFTTIKLYNLKEWYVKKLSLIHKNYLKIGQKSIVGGTTETALRNFIAMILKYGTYAIIGVFVLCHNIDINTAIKTIAVSGTFFNSTSGIFSCITKYSIIGKAKTRLSEWFQGLNNEDFISKGPIYLDDVSVCCEGKEIFRHVNFSFPADGVCFIKGANGAGKSTLLKLIMGLIMPTTGRINIGGVAPNKLADANFPDAILYLPQDDPVFSVCSYELYRMVLNTDISFVLNVAKKFGLNDDQLKNTKINELSGGERKKVFLSLAFAINPLILLLDEPSNFLDEKGKNQLISELKERRGLTFLTTHDTALECISDYVYVLGEGNVSYEKTKKS